MRHESEAEFELDKARCIKNLEKHKLDFADARQMVDGHATVTKMTRYQMEPRFLTVFANNEKLFTVVWTWWGEIRRIISFRRACNAEAESYRQIHGWELRAMQARGETLSDWEAAAAMTDEELEAAIADDPDEAGMVVDWSSASPEMPRSPFEPHHKISA